MKFDTSLALQRYYLKLTTREIFHYSVLTSNREKDPPEFSVVPYCRLKPQQNLTFILVKHYVILVITKPT